MWFNHLPSLLVLHLPFSYYYLPPVQSLQFICHPSHYPTVTILRSSDYLVTILHSSPPKRLTIIGIYHVSYLINLITPSLSFDERKNKQKNIILSSFLSNLSYTHMNHPFNIISILIWHSKKI